MKLHYTPGYLLNPPHRITVNVIGAGGTGSQVITGLARMNQALIGLAHPGLFVRLWDNDEVSAANAGRQLFSSADIGQFKSTVLISRINRFFGYDWEAKTTKYSGQKKANITVTCIDTAKGRIAISEQLMQRPFSSDPLINAMYWLDLGNLQKTGQVVLGTLQPIPQPKKEKSAVASLPSVVKLFPQLKKINESDQGPSCSLAEALRKQDLFINSTLAQYGCNLLWKLFREGMLKYQGCFVNLDSYTVNPIRIK